MLAAIGKFLGGKLKKLALKAAAGDESSQRKLAGIILLPVVLFLLIIIVIIMLLFGPIMLAKEYVIDIKDNTPEFVQNFITSIGWCAEGDTSCQEYAEQAYYKELNKTYETYENKNAKIDVELITATITYKRYVEPDLYELNEDGQNQRFIDYYCEAHTTFLAADFACNLYVKENYDKIYNENKEKYIKIARNYKELEERFCLDNNNTIENILDIASVTFPKEKIVFDFGVKLVNESCELSLWHMPEVANAVVNTEDDYLIYKHGKDDIDNLAKNMLNGTRLDYLKYKEYLIKEYIPKNYSEAYMYEENKEKAIEQLANEIMGFASLEEEKKYTNQTSNCSYNEKEKIDINIDKNNIDLYYVKTLQPYCKHIKNCSESDVEYVIPLKEYVTGVVYREIRAGTDVTNDETVKANLIAIKSYTLGRRKATEENGKYYITMRNNTNDQVYCNLDEGCNHYKSLGETNLQGSASMNIKQWLYGLYDEVANEFLYNYQQNKFDGAYTANKSWCLIIGLQTNCMSQNKSISMGKEGDNYKAILSAFYNDNMGILDINTETVSIGAYACGKTAYMGGGNYSSNVPAYDNSNDFFANINYNYFLPPSYEYYGECPWYAKGRAIEILDNSNMPDSLKNDRINFLRNMRGNGAEWYNNPSNELFSKSTDLYAAKPGSIVSWLGGDVACGGSPMGLCGHVGIIEDVEYDSNGKAVRVLLTDGWNKRVKGVKIPSYSFRWLDMKALERYSVKNKYYFNGYVYLLD